MNAVRAERRWEDLRWRRLVAGLAIAPIPPMLLSLPFIVAAAASSKRGLPPTAVAAAGLGFYVVLMELWSIGTGMVWLGLVARRRRRVRRRTCLILGAVGAILFPVAVATLGASVFEADFMAFMRAKLWIIGLVFGIPALPFGLLGGWVFWRFAVRPAATTAQLAPVFD